MTTAEKHALRIEQSTCDKLLTMLVIARGDGRNKYEEMEDDDGCVSDFRFIYEDGSILMINTETSMWMPKYLPTESVDKPVDNIPHIAPHQE